MKGLLLKDWYMILKYCRAFLVILVIFMGVSAVSESALFFALYPMILVTMVPVTLMSYEEKSGWNIYCDTMPNTRRKVVNSKYILLLLFLGACLLLMGLSQLMRMAYTNGMNFEAFWSMIGLLAAVGLISPCLMMPVIFRFGTEKGRLFYYFLVGSLAALFVIVAKLDPEISLTGVLPTWILGAILAGAAVLFILSWGLSICFYEKREF